MEFPSSPQTLAGSNCRVSSSQDFENMDTKLMGRMIKISAVKPPDRCTQIIKWRQELAYEQQDKIRAWGLQVSYLLFDTQQRADGQINKQLMKVPARILPAPSVMYARNQDARPTDGSWNLRGKEVS
jgi:eukaryotic translation initiation factor 2C